MIAALDTRPLRNRRAYERVRCAIPLHYAGEMGPPQDALMKDLSAGGVCFRAMDFLPIDSWLKIDFALPPLHEAFSMVGKVVWVREVPHLNRHEVGVQFVEISDQEKRHIQKYVDDRLLH